jgi:hypothetical protein
MLSKLGVDSGSQKGMLAESIAWQKWEVRDAISRMRRGLGNSTTFLTDAYIVGEKILYIAQKQL